MSEELKDDPDASAKEMQMLALRGVGVEAGAHGGVGTPKAKDDDQCGVPENPAGFSYECTLPKGHDGPHVAHGANWKELHRWAQPVPLSTPQKKETVTTGFSSRTMASGAMCAPSGAPDWMATSASSALPESTDEARNRVEPSGEDSVHLTSPRMTDAMTESAARAKKFFKPYAYSETASDILAVRMCAKIYNVTARAKFRGTPITDDELRTINSAAFAGVDGPDPDFESVPLGTLHQEEKA